MKKVLAIVFILTLWGVVKISWENKISKNLNISREEILVLKHLKTEWLLAATGGFRGIVANFLWLETQKAWEEKDWLRLHRNIEIITMLQPRETLFWEIGAWHLAWNASIATLHDHPDLQGRIESKQWIQVGQDLLERGIRANPEKACLLLKLADLHWQRQQDYRAAAQCYGEASEKNDAPSYAERFEGYALEKAGDEQAAYDHFKKLWQKRENEPDSPERRWDIVSQHLRDLEGKLQIPVAKRIFAK